MPPLSLSLKWGGFISPFAFITESLVKVALGGHTSRELPDPLGPAFSTPLSEIQSLCF